MPPRAATAAARRHGAAAAPAYAPRAPRRVSGPRPAHRPAGGATVAVPPALGIGRRLRALPDHRLLDRLLRSRAWIWLMGIGLGGIVAMQVSLLKLNTGISRAVQASATLERSNAQLEEQVAVLSSGDRVRAAAAARGMLLPDAGTVDYLTVRPGFDGRRAVAHMQPPSQQARELLATGTSGVIAPPSLAPAPAPAPAVTPAAAATPAATATPAPVATATPAPAAAAPPTQSSAPPTQAGAAAAPAGE